MAFHIRDAETDKVVRELARRTGLTMTDAVKSAAQRELSRIGDGNPADRQREVRAAISEIQQRVASRGKSGLQADKAFYDWLSGDE